MRVVLAFALALWAVPACADIVIGNDPGGNVVAYAEKYQRIKQSGQYVRLVGDCISACTEVLSLPLDHVCAEPQARLAFHSPSIGNHIAPRALVQEFAREFYPPAVRTWFLSRPPSLTLRYVRADRIVRPCHGY